MIAAFVHGHRRVHRLQQAFLVDASEDEAALVQRLRALRARADAHRREGMADAGEEAALLRQRAAIADHAEGVHLQAVVVVEAQRLVLDHARVKLETALLQALPAARVAGVQDGHVVLLRHPVDRREQAGEVLLRVDVLFTMGREQDVPALLDPQPRVNVAGLDLGEVVVQHLGHGAASHIGALFGQAAVRQIAPGVLRIAQVDVRDDVHDAAVGLFRQALVLAAVARLHVENRDVQPLRTDDRQAGVRIAQHQHRIGLEFHHQVVALGNDVAHRLAECLAHGVHVDLRICELQVAEEHAVEVVVVVLPRMGEDGVKVLAALFDDRRQTDDLRARAHDDEQLQFAVVLKRGHSFLLVHLSIGVALDDNASFHLHLSGNAVARLDDRAHADVRIRANRRVVVDDRATVDDAAIFDRAIAVDQRFGQDRHALAEFGGRADVCRRMDDVDHMRLCFKQRFQPAFTHVVIPERNEKCRIVIDKPRKIGALADDAGRVGIVIQKVNSLVCPDLRCNVFDLAPILACAQNHQPHQSFTFSKNVSGLFGSKISLQVITVTKSSVSLRLMMLCVQPGIM